MAADVLRMKFSAKNSPHRQSENSCAHGKSPNFNTTMKTIKFAAFLFYRYYSGGRRPDSAPFFSTMLSMTLLGFMHLIQVLIIFDKMDLISISPTDSKGTKRFIIFLVMLPIYLLLNLLIKKKDLEEVKERNEYNWDKVFNGNVWLIVYMILSFALIFVLAVWLK